MVRSDVTHTSSQCRSSSLRCSLPLCALLNAHTAASEATFPEATLTTLPAVFASVPDPRSRHGQRYDLPFLLTCPVAALLCGCGSLDAVGQWTHDRRTLLTRHFGLRRHLTPTGLLYRRLLPRLSAAHLEAALAAWVRQTRPLRERESVAFDGKVVRGAVTITQSAPHLLSITTHDTGETLLQVRVDDKTNEIPVAQEVVPHLPLRGCVVTADALHTQTATAQVTLDQHADYVLVIEDNQPRLHAELVAYFGDPRATARSATTTDRVRIVPTDGPRRARCMPRGTCAPTWRRMSPSRASDRGPTSCASKASPAPKPSTSSPV